MVVGIFDRAISLRFRMENGTNVSGSLIYLMLTSLPSMRVSQKALKRREPQRHKDTKFFWSCLSCVGTPKKLPLCLRVFVVQGFYAFCDSLEGGCCKSSNHSPSSPRRRGSIVELTNWRYCSLSIETSFAASWLLEVCLLILLYVLT